MSAIGQPARGSGMSTVLSGARIFAVSAMKWTPAKTITRCVGRGGLTGQAERVSNDVGDVLDLRALVVVREQDRVALGDELADLVGDRACALRDSPGRVRSCASALDGADFGGHRDEARSCR